MKEIGTKPELEVHSSAGVDNYYFLTPSGFFADPVNFNFVWGVCGGASFRPGSFVAMVGALSPGAHFSTCGVGLEERPAITQSNLFAGGRHETHHSSVSNHKGGAGKTTTAVSLAAGRVKSGRKIAPIYREKLFH